MSLAPREERELARIEGALRRSDPRLAAKLSTFNRLNQSEEMPRREFLLRPTRMRWLTQRPGPRPDRQGGPPPLMQSRHPFPARPARSARPTGSARPHWFALSPRPSRLPRDRTRASQPRWPSRMAQIVPVIMATCALGLVVVIFTMIGHGKPETMSQSRGSQCVPTVVNSCQPSSGSAGPSAKGRAG
ncbi:MAG TPA: hypothetical protein VHW06_03565 [Streptosporangiaceae bacterium]|nr:hypothetical protein [Streptosporangiaceae bacterium]